jgi:hypothetical protein
VSAWVHTLYFVFLAFLGGLPMPSAGHVSAKALAQIRMAMHGRDDAETRGRALVERAIEAHGGREAWLGKHDVSFSTTWTHYRDGKARFSTRYVVKFPTDPSAARGVVLADENGKPVVMGISGSRSWFFVGEEAHEDAESLKANRAFVKKAVMLLAVPFLLDDASYRVRYDGHEVRGGVEVDRVRVEHGLDPTAYLLFETSSGRFAGMGSVVADVPTTTLGEAHDHEMVQGILIPRTQSFDRVDLISGEVTRAMSVTVDAVRFNNGFTEATFEPPL